MKEREILLNLMYAGKYLESKDNIGHEIINLFQCDNGNNYIYVLPCGMMGKEHNDRVDAILLARRHSASKIEILAKAVGLKQLTYAGKKDRATLHQTGLKYVIHNQVKYGGVYLKDIPFGDNERAVFVTFQADKIIKAKRPFYITTVKSEHKNSFTYPLPDVENFSRQSQKMYFSSERHPETYKLLHKLIDTPTLWGQPPVPIKVTKEGASSNKINFMQILKKEYDELAFSNMFAYIFESNPTGFQKFAHKCLGIPNWGKTFEIKREYNNIDILLSDGQKVLIIENKIKSGLNGKAENKDQLDKYWKMIAEDSVYKGLKPYGFVFVPDYNSDVVEDVQKQHKGKYTCLKYSQVYKFFKKYRNLYCDVPYYDEFLSSIKKHTSLVDNYLEEETYKKFLAAICRERLRKTK